MSKHTNDASPIEINGLSKRPHSLEAPHRRRFLHALGITGVSAAVGAIVPFYRNMPLGFVPVAAAEALQSPLMAGKGPLTLLNDRPLNVETPAHLLDDAVTPISNHFIRNNGVPPTNMDASTWRLSISGLVENPLELSIDQLKSEFEVVTRKVVLECAGNGRSFFEPGAKGNQWSLGAVACSSWTGVRLADVLKKAKLKSNAVYTAHYGADTHLSGKPNKLPISRGIPIEKALKDDSIIAFEMNGQAIHPMNGAPLRLVVAGWPASCSQKWLTRIDIRDQVHDGAKMTGKSYRVPNRPVYPGEKVDKKDFEIIHRMPVKSLITFPQTGTQQTQLVQEVRGHAWSGERTVQKVELSIDFGATWQLADLQPQENSGAWQSFVAKVKFPQKGYYEIWSRATDDANVSQPFAINWNPKGYLNNSLHRISVKAV